MQKDKLLAQLTINTKTYSIRATNHALQRMKQRNIDEYAVTGSILALGETNLLELQAAQEDAIIIDEKTCTATVIGFKKNTVKVITVINKTNVFAKTGTTIHKI